jgi:hypothetical protein
MGNQFLNLMLDPFVDGRSGVGGAGGSALGFAPEREELPDDIALAYSSVLKAPPVKASTLAQRWSVWGGAYGGGNRTSGDPAVVGSHDFSASTVGFTAGLDYHLTPDTAVGLALAGGGTSWSLSQGLGGGRSDAFQAGIYGATRSGPAYLAAAFAFANHWMSTDRVAVGDHLTADFNAQSYGGRLEAGYRFGTPYGGVAPYAAIQAQSFHTPGYTETGVVSNGFALAFASRDATDTRSELGARFDRVLVVYANSAVRARCVGARLGEQSDADAAVPDASGRKLHCQRRDPGAELRARLGGHRASARQRRHPARQVRRRVREPIIDLCRHWHRAIYVVGRRSFLRWSVVGRFAILDEPTDGKPRGAPGGPRRNARQRATYKGNWRPICDGSMPVRWRVCAQYDRTARLPVPCEVAIDRRLRVNSNGKRNNSNARAAVAACHTLDAGLRTQQR